MTNRDSDSARGKRNAVLYARVSSGRQAERELSIPDQIRQMKDHCQRNETAVLRCFEDAHTGTKMDRPAFSEMRDYIASNPGLVDEVIVHSFSRFSRDLIGGELERRFFEKAGVKVVSVTQPVDDSSTGDLLRQLIAMMDEHASRETSKHVTRSMAENARQGYWNGGLAPFGYRTLEDSQRGGRSKKVLAINPLEAEDVRAVFALYNRGDGVSGPMGIKQLTSYLNRNGRQYRGRPWSIGSVDRILKDRTYVGERIHGRAKPVVDQVHMSVPQIIDHTLFEHTQQRLRSRNPRKKPPRSINNPVLLSGLARCGRCGGGMTLRTGKSGRYRYYTCGNQARKGPSACIGQSIPMDVLDDIVVAELVPHVMDRGRFKELLAKVLEKVETEDLDAFQRLGDLESELRDRQTVVSRLFRMVETGLGNVDDPEFRERFQRAKIEADIAKSKIDDAQRKHQSGRVLTDAQVDQLHKVVEGALKHGSGPFRKAYFHLFVRVVEVCDNDIRIIAR